MNITIYVLVSGDGYGHNSIEGATIDEAYAKEWKDSMDNRWLETFDESLNIKKEI